MASSVPSRIGHFAMGSHPGLGLHFEIDLVASLALASAVRLKAFGPQGFSHLFASGTKANWSGG